MWKILIKFFENFKDSKNRLTVLFCNQLKMLLISFHGHSWTPEPQWMDLYSFLCVCFSLFVFRFLSTLKSIFFTFIFRKHDISKVGQKVTLLDWRFLALIPIFGSNNSEFVRAQLNIQSNSRPSRNTNQSNSIIWSRDFFEFRYLVTLCYIT